MKKKCRAKSLAQQGEDFELDPVTRRSRFCKNNKAAMVHGGYSTDIPEPVLQAVIDNDLGFEVGVLKGQLSNIATMGKVVVEKLIEQGEAATALSVILSCADRTSKLVPQIQKALESPLLLDDELSEKKRRLKTRLLKKLQAGGCSASEVAVLYEINELGPIPLLVLKKLEQELKNQPFEASDELYSREEIQRKLADYRESITNEEHQKAERLKAVHQQKLEVSNSYIKDKSHGQD